MICPSCRQEVPEKKFCVKCGKPLAPPASAAPAADVPAAGRPPAETPSASAQPADASGTSTQAARKPRMPLAIAACAAGLLVLGLAAWWLAPGDHSGHAVTTSDAGGKTSYDSGGGDVKRPAPAPVPEPPEVVAEPRVKTVTPVRPPPPVMVPGPWSLVFESPLFGQVRGTCQVAVNGRQVSLVFEDTITAPGPDGFIHQTRERMLFQGIVSGRRLTATCTQASSWLDGRPQPFAALPLQLEGGLDEEGAYFEGLVVNALGVRFGVTLCAED